MLVPGITVTVKEIQAGKFCQISSPFLLVMHTARERELLVNYGNTVMLMDAIIQNMQVQLFFCFFLTVKTSVGIGQVVASTITKFETEEMLKASNSENLEPLPSL